MLSFESLADSMTDIERENVRKICRRFLAEKLMFLNDADEKWVLDYLSSGKGMTPYQMIIDIDSLQIFPEDGFFEQNKVLSLEELSKLIYLLLIWNFQISVQKLYCLMRFLRQFLKKKQKHFST